MARLTTIGQSLISAAVGSGPKLDITKFVFANIPGLDHTVPEPADEPMPAPENIVFERAPTKAGIIDENRVTYSQMMLTDIGDFEFNWIGLVQANDLVMFAYVPLTQKIKTLHPTVGNVLTRNMVIEHLSVANATPVVVSAESWMYDFGGEMTLINDRLDAIDIKVAANEVQRVYKTAGATTLVRKSTETVFHWDSVNAGSVAIDASTYQVGDKIEITNIKDDGGTLTISNPDGKIHVPNGVSEASHTLTGRGTVTIYKLSADNDDLTITSVHK